VHARARWQEASHTQTHTLSLSSPPPPPGRREVVSLGRELLGGNGIVSDFLVAKAFCDLEAYYSYEGERAGGVGEGEGGLCMCG
jgi:hypothetical protein